MSYNNVMANVLPRDKQVAVLNALVEGNSIRSTERMLGVHRDTVMRLGVRVGEGCAVLLDEKMRNLSCTRLELDELWAFIGKKQRRVHETDDASRVGDVWTWVAIDPETKIVPSFMTGKRDAETARAFVQDLAARLLNRVQLTSDGLGLYIRPIAEAFGAGGVDYAQLHKTYEAEPIGPGRYSPPKVTGTDKTPIFGSPQEGFVSTSFVERSNLTIRMGVRRFTRLTNAHSKKLENHGAAVALHFAHYNFARRHMTTRCTPAQEASIESEMWSMERLLDAALERVEDK
jgi:IS1 family transposase